MGPEAAASYFTPSNLPGDLDPWLTLATPFAPGFLPCLGAVGQGWPVSSLPYRLPYSSCSQLPIR